MEQRERGLEFKVGIFVFFGLAMLAALVVEFGRLGEGFKSYYSLTVRFTDASGLLKGSNVLLAGAKIGEVADGPHLVRGEQGVDVPLRIYDYVKIPEDSKFAVGSSGLLGDRFVDVTMPSGQPKGYLPQGAHITGVRETGLSDLTKQGGAIVNDLRGTMQKLDTTITHLNQDVLSQSNTQNLKATMAHLNKATGDLAATSQKLNGVVEKAGATMDSAKKAADDLQGTVTEAKKTIETATQGRGAIAALLTDPTLANNLRSLISNLRAHGVLFYRDTTSPAATKPTGKPARRTEERPR